MVFPAPFDVLTEGEYKALESVIETLKYSAGTLIFEEGSPGDGCYIIDDGRVRVELGSDSSHTDDDSVLAYMEPGTILGELSLLDRLPRSASAYAHTDVTTRHISVQSIDHLVETQPHLGAQLLGILGKSASLKLRHATDQLDQYIHVRHDSMVESMVERALVAQRVIQEWPEDRIDALLLAMAQVIDQHAEELAELAVSETKIGNVPDKTLKNRLASLGVYNELAGHKATGQIALDSDLQVAQVANPVGVIFGLVPMTNPTSTFAFKALICIKARNAVILSPSQQAVNCSSRVGELLQGVLRDHGAPEDLVQWIRVGNSRKTASMFMTHPKIALILATGGPSMVKAAYSSGNPAIGVGSGNAPALICADADLEDAARNIVSSKSFDYGLICASENNVVVNAQVKDAFLTAMQHEGAAILTPEETAALLHEAVDSERQKLKASVVGQPASDIAQRAGIQRDYPIRLLVVPLEHVSDDTPFTFEKLAPMISLLVAKDDADGIALCRSILAIDGSGHTAIIYSHNQAVIDRFGREIPASRILVNTPGVLGALGATTGLVPSLTLGCGTFGHNSTTDNVTYTHLMNIKRLAYNTPGRLEKLLAGSQAVHS